MLETYTFLKVNLQRRGNKVLIWLSATFSWVLILCCIAHILLSTGRYWSLEGALLAESAYRVCWIIIQSLLFSHTFLICLYEVRLVGLATSSLQWLPAASFLSLSSSSTLPSLSNTGEGRLSRIQNPQLWNSTHDTGKIKCRQATIVSTGLNGILR